MLTEETISNILSRYDLGSLISKETMSAGTVQENIKVITANGEYFMKYYKTRTKEYVKFELTLIDYLNKHNYVCPIIFKTTKGKCQVLHDNKVVAIYEFIKAEHKKQLKYHHFDQLIHAVAQLHSITKDLKLKGYAHRWNYDVEFCKNYIDENLKEKNDDNSNRKKEWLFKELKTLVLPEELSTGIIHGDLDTSNILFINDTLKAIIDFDDSNYSYLMLDIIGLIERKDYRFLGNKYFELIRYILTKYEKLVKLSTADKLYLFDVLKLSILIDCFWFFDRGAFSDFIEKEKIDQINLIGRDSFYQKIKSKN